MVWYPVVFAVFASGNDRNSRKYRDALYELGGYCLTWTPELLDILEINADLYIILISHLIRPYNPLTPPSPSNSQSLFHFLPPLPPFLSPSLAPHISSLSLSRTSTAHHFLTSKFRKQPTCSTQNTSTLGIYCCDLVPHPSVLTPSPSPSCPSSSLW